MGIPRLVIDQVSRSFHGSQTSSINTDLRSLEWSHRQGQDKGGGELVFNGDTASAWEDKKVLQMDGGVHVRNVQCERKVLNATELRLKGRVSDYVYLTNPLQWSTLCYVCFTILKKEKKILSRSLNLSHSREFIQRKSSNRRQRGHVTAQLMLETL